MRGSREEVVARIKEEGAHFQERLKSDEAQGGFRGVHGTQEGGMKFCRPGIAPASPDADIGRGCRRGSNPMSLPREAERMSMTHRKLTTIFSADVQGYSRLMAADEEGTLATLKQYRDAMARLIEAHARPRRQHLGRRADRRIPERGRIGARRDRRPERAGRAQCRPLDRRRACCSASASTSAT